MINVTPSASRAAWHRRLIAAVAVAVAVAILVLSGCGASGGNDSAATRTSANDRGTTTTRTDPSDDTTTTSDNETTTTSNDATTTGPDRSTTTTTTSAIEEELRVALPAAADIGAPYAYAQPDSNDSADAAGDAAVEKACPEAAALDTGNDDDKGKVTARFETEDGRTIEVSAKPDASDFGTADIDTVVDAINACDVIEFEQDGTAVQMTLAAQREDAYGEAGVRLGIDVEFAGPPTPDGKKLQFHLEGVTFVVGDLSGSVFATSGLDPATFAPIEADLDRIDPLAINLATELDRLAD